MTRVPGKTFPYKQGIRKQKRKAKISPRKLVSAELQRLIRQFPIVLVQDRPNFFYVCLICRNERQTWLLEIIDIVNPFTPKLEKHILPTFQREGV